MTWIGDPAFAPDAPFGPQTLPLGVFSVDPVGFRSVGVRVGDHVLDVSRLAAAGALPYASLLTGGSLDPLLAATRPQWTDLRAALTDLVLRDRAPADVSLHHVSQVRLHLPFTVADYVDFYSSRHHAENVGRILRPSGPALLPNWEHLPVAYHGRSGTVVVSGTPVVRPCGQFLSGAAGPPVFGPTQRLDFEAEVGFVCGGPVRGCVPVDEVAEHVFGVVLVNDWSARDVQAWEYQPLGPFLGKSFATSISAWVTPLDALAAARVPLPASSVDLLPYLRGGEPWGFDIALSVSINGSEVSRPPFALMSYSCAQQLAHLTVNGATVRPGDLFASGTVSGPARSQRGCLLELTWGGREPITLADGSVRTFLADGDEVVITAVAPGPDRSVAVFGEVTGRVLPSGASPERAWHGTG
jgi:fumarylacetoacetase